MIVLVSKDLFFVPVFKSAARKLHQEVMLVSHVEDEKLERIDPTDVVAVVVDLSAISADGLDEAAHHLGEICPGAVRAAFGSHVHTGRLSLARSAGFEPVLTRGQIDNRLPRLMQEWVQSRA